MARQERSGPPDEKVTVNLGPVDLGTIDLLVAEGVYASRTDFIRDAIRRQLEAKGDLVEQVMTRRTWTVGVVSYNAAALRKHVDEGQRLKIFVIGALVLSSDVTPELADAAIDGVHVFGSFRATPAVRERLRAKTVRGATG